ncbi:MAG: DoxX family protein, partial [Promethearchaeota archaeon]
VEMAKNRISNLGIFILRVTFPLMLLLAYGWPKFKVLVSGNPIQFADPIGLGVTLSFFLVVIAEFFCMIPVVLGFFNRFFLILS